MRMFFFAHLSKKERLDAARDYLDQLKSVADELQSVRPDVEANADRFQFLCFQFGLRYSKDLIRNVEEVISELQKDE
jgi:ribosome assembly protein YihI (activator of Der GTPase)